MAIYSIGRKIPLDLGVVLPRVANKHSAEKYYGLYRETCIFYHFRAPITITLNGKVHKTAKNACVFVKGTKDHTFITETENLHDWVHFKNDITPLLNFYGIETDKIYYPADVLFIENILGEIEREAVLNPTAPFADLLLMGKTEEFLILFARKIATEKAPEYLPSSVLQTLKTVREYMLENYTEIESVPVLAKHACMSESDFYRRYRQAFGISPKKDMLNMKIEKSQDMLVGTVDTVESISEKLGYATPEQFIKQFKLYCGTTPARFRKDHAAYGKTKSPLLIK